MLFFKILSLFGVLLGISLFVWGILGNGMASFAVLLAGFFVMVKEIMDLIFAGAGVFFFIALSLFGVLVGVFLITQGLAGNELGAFPTVLLGLFVTVKEIMDIVFSG